MEKGEGGRRRSGKPTLRCRESMKIDLEKAGVNRRECEIMIE